MKKMMLIALVATMFTLTSIAFAQGTMSGTPDCDSNMPVIDGRAVVTNDGSETTYIIQGQQGPQGRTGASGAAGQDGQNGQNGYNGYNGINGRNGHRGRRGAQGPQGPQGPQGIPGRDGCIVTVPASTTTSGNAGEGGDSMIGLWVVLGILAAGALGWAITATIMSSDSKVQLANNATAQGQIGLGQHALANQGQFAPNANANVRIFAMALPGGGHIMRAESNPLQPQQQPHGVALPAPAQWPALPPANNQQPAAQPAANVMTNDAFAALMGAVAQAPLRINMGGAQQPGQNS